METRTLAYGRNPVWANKEKTAINLFVSFHELKGELPFTATSYDDLPHGREIFNRAAAEEFGPIGDYVGPTLEQLSNELRYFRDMMLKDCDWTQLPDVPLSTRDAWAVYRQQLRDITLQPNFPNQVDWPIPPSQ